MCKGVKKILQTNLNINICISHTENTNNSFLDKIILEMT